MIAMNVTKRCRACNMILRDDTSTLEHKGRVWRSPVYTCLNPTCKLHMQTKQHLDIDLDAYGATQHPRWQPWIEE